MRVRCLRGRRYIKCGSHSHRQGHELNEMLLSVTCGFRVCEVRFVSIFGHKRKET
jgi:hypothetical protein